MSEPERKPFWQRFINVESDPEAPAVGGDLSDLGDLSVPPAKEKPSKVKPKEKSSPLKDEAAPAEPVTPSRTALDWTLEEVFRGGKAELGRNSAETVIKLREGLKNLPSEQQLAMVRVMDSADDTWDEEHITSDAKNRVAILTRYLDFVAKDEQVQVARATEASTAISEATSAEVTDLDAQIRVLQLKRAEKIKVIEKAQADADVQAQSVRARADKVRLTVAGAIDRYKGLLTFFGA
jgi:hypothetical protein